MYLEEHVEQLEALAVDQSKQSELIAKAVAKLTIDTQQGLDSLRKGQTELQEEITRLADSVDGTNERVTQVDRKIEEVNEKFAQVDAKQNELRQDINGMRQDIAELKIGQELILQILREKLP